MRHLLRRNSRAGIYHGKAHFSIDRLGGNGYSSLSRREFHGVTNQVGQHLLDSRGIGRHPRQVVGYARLHDDGAAERERAQHIDGVVHEHFRRLWSHFDREMPALHALHVEQILNHAVHAVRGSAHDLLLPSLLDALRRRRLEHQADRHRDGVERVAEIVRDDSENIVARPRCLLRLVKKPSVLDNDRRPARDIGRQR